VPTWGNRRQIKRRESKFFVLRSVAMALTLLLHLCAFVWLTLPAMPWTPTMRSTTGVQPLRVRFIKISLPKEIRAPIPVPHPSSPRTLIARTETSNHPLPKPPIPAQQSAVSNTPSPPAEATIPSTNNPEPEATPYNAYGNSNFGRALSNSQGGSETRLPGDDEPVRVPGIHVETPPSLAQRVGAIGHVLNCKDALFKSRMTDEELAKRGLTEQQMLLKFVALGCH
jgi:hypothetical protein